ncbi:MAG: 2-amino-4-hydroxy-6-hydroxymethyldihydropteridine diphosphokinase [Myxococcota bacterium]
MTLLAGVGLGASGPLGPRFLRQAWTALASRREVTLLALSPLYWSAPWGGGTEAPFANGAVVLSSPLTPRGLLALLQQVERHHGRVRGKRYGGRSLDLDLLCVAGVTMTTTELSLPHPRLLERPFALLPLLDAWGRAGQPVPAAWSLAARRLSRRGLSLLEDPGAGGEELKHQVTGPRQHAVTS